MTKLFRMTTVPMSLEKLLNGQWKFFKDHYDITAISSDKDRLTKFGEDFKTKTFYVPLTRKITPFKDLKSIWFLYEYFKKENPKIVHTQTPKAGLIGMLAAYFAGVPIRIHDVVGLPMMEKKGLKYCILYIVEKFVYALSHRVYPNSFGLADYMDKVKLSPKNKMKVLANGSSNGLDTSFFSKENFPSQNTKALKKKLSIENTDFVFLYAGRLVGDKGINELVDAFLMLLERELNVKLVLVGPYEKHLDPLKSKTIDKIERTDQIITVGYKKEVRPYYTIASCFVFPSYREGFPNVVLEALSMELPCIVTDINGSNEIIKNEFNGIIIPKKNMHALLEAMIVMKSNEVLRRFCTQNSRDSVLKKYDKELFYDVLLAEYKSLEKDL